MNGHGDKNVVCPGTGGLWRPGRRLCGAMRGCRGVVPSLLLQLCDPELSGRGGMDGVLGWAKRGGVEVRRVGMRWHNPEIMLTC